MTNIQSRFDTWSNQVHVVDQAGKGFGRDAISSVSGRKGSVGITPEYPLYKAKYHVQNDETLYGAIVTKVDATVNNGWFLTGTNKQELERARKLFSKRKFTSSVLRPLCYSLYLNGNSFVEVVADDDDGDPGMYIVETSQVEIYDESGHGIATKYVQRVTGDVTPVEWTPEEMVHFRLDRFNTSLWAEVPVRPLEKYLELKKEVKAHLYRLFKSNAFRSVISFPEKTVDEDVNRSIAEYKLAAKDPNRPFLWFGGVEQSVLQDFKDGPQFIEVINLCDHAMLVQLQVPPIMAGVPDASGRASGEQQTYKAFNTHIRSAMNTLQEIISSELLPKLGFKSVQFHFNELDAKSEKDIMEMAVQLKALGAKPDKFTAWLQGQGIAVDDDFFDPEFFQSPVQQSKQEQNAISNKSGAPSRKGANGARKSIGTGSESSTREDQIVSQSKDDLDEEIERAMKKLKVNLDE
jgi:hypothetical protein